MSTASIRPATEPDASAIAAIYNHYVRETVITFEEQAVDDQAMADRLRTVQAQDLPFLVSETHQGVVGYAYATPWRQRSAYRHSVESSVYLAPAATGRGLGLALYRSLLDELRRRPVHAVIGGITLPNPASVAVHERAGFTRVGHFPEIGRKFGRWLDVGYWQLTLPDADPLSPPEDGR